ncbi:hypothetical protein [Chryseobacterium balustinum]|uniref:hypothetical protein n=1 Tax=Chryseobacterium balustinum TaxID=246 RepID=UPI003CF0EC84
MNSKELRIGNWVEFNGKHGIVITIGKKSVIIELGTKIKEHSAYTESENPNLDEIKPIPLDEEWLLKFGFKNITLKYQENSELIGLYLENLDSYLTFDNNEWRLEQDDDWRDGGNHHDLPNFEFVHQLQNLYFALTGKELTLK